METKLILKYSLLGVILILYLIITIKYSIVFKKNTYFKGRRRKFHAIMIWLFPFVWIAILKSFLKPTPGSVEFLDKKDPDGFQDNTTGWVTWAASSPPGSGSSSK